MYLHVCVLCVRHLWNSSSLHPSCLKIVPWRNSRGGAVLRWNSNYLEFQFTQSKLLQIVVLLLWRNCNQLCQALHYVVFERWTVHTYAYTYVCSWLLGWNSLDFWINTMYVLYMRILYMYICVLVRVCVCVLCVGIIWKSSLLDPCCLRVQY